MAAGDVNVTFSKTRGLGCNMFDGVDDYVEIPHNAAQLGANLSNGFTISAWINPRSQGETEGAILDKSTNTFAANGFRFNIGTAGFNFPTLRINAGTQATGAANSTPYGVWSHVIVTVSSTQRANFYINGVLNGNADQNLVQAVSTITTTNLPRIGNRANATDRSFDGSIRDVKMWNRVLTTTEITEEYAGKHHSDGCIHFFKLGGDYTDYGSVGVTATNSGSTPAIVDDTLAGVIKTQRATAGATGKFLLSTGHGGQLYTAAISE